jgi:hypothetical protein
MKTLALIIALTATLAMAGYRNINTQATGLPERLGNTERPTFEQCLSIGVRIEPEIPPVAEGYVRQSIRLVEGNGTTGKWQIVDIAQAQLDAEAAAARLASFTPHIAHAAQFKALMRAYFGEGAETNRTITAAYVETYFLTTNGLTIEAIQHGMALKGMFEELSAWNGTGETWTLPWEVVP